MVGGILGQEPTSDPELLFAFVGACGFQAVFFGLPGIQSGHLEEQMIDVVLSRILGRDRTSPAGVVNPNRSICPPAGTHSN